MSVLLHWKHDILAARQHSKKFFILSLRSHHKSKILVKYLPDLIVQMNAVRTNRNKLFELTIVLK